MLQDIQAGAIERDIVHGIVGGGLSAAHGGKFWRGFANNFVGQAVGGQQFTKGGLGWSHPYEAALLDGLVSGGMSAAAGGNFATGFGEGVAGFLYNDGAHHRFTLQDYNNIGGAISVYTRTAHDAYQAVMDEKSLSRVLGGNLGIYGLGLLLNNQGYKPFNDATNALGFIDLNVAAVRGVHFGGRYLDALMNGGDMAEEASFLLKSGELLGTAGEGVIVFNGLHYVGKHLVGPVVGTGLGDLLTMTPAETHYMRQSWFGRFLHGFDQCDCT